MYKILLCLRYLRTRYIALASIVSVMLGVATMIVVNSVMAGFSTEMRSRIHGILADVIVEANSLDGVPDGDKQLAFINEVAGEYISDMTATVEVYGMLSFEYAGQWITRPVTLIGIEPDEKARVGPLVDYLESYQTIKNGDEVVRTPLRSSAAPPGWTLTEDAKQHRIAWVERERWLRELMQGDGDSGDANGDSGDGFDPLKELGIDDESSENSATEVGPRNGPPRFSNTSGKPSTVVEKKADATGKPADFIPPGLIEPLTPVAESTETTDQAAPLEGRLYVGNGLIQFLVEGTDGEKRIMHMVKPGDDVKISTVSAGRPPEARHFDATIVDVFRSGMSEYDSNLVFCNIEYLQKVRGMFDPSTGQIDPKTGQIDPSTCVSAITSIQIQLNDFNDADEVVKRLRAALPPDVFSVKTWEQKQGALLAAVEVESAILNVLLFMIIAVAGFGILAIFYMIVVEKTRDIGIMKALGAGSRGIMSIFLSYGLGLGIVGSGVGVGVGLLFVYYINEIEAGITWLTGRKVFDDKIYYFPEIPTSVHPAMVMWVAFGAVTIAILASILPARRASRLHPVEALRYE